jgi:hypothetical protein
MTPVLLIIVVVAIAIAVMMAKLRNFNAVPTSGGARREPAARPTVRDTIPARRARVPERAAPESADPGLEWDAPVLDASRQAGAPSPAVVADLHRAQRVRIRGRYLAGRFPGVVRAVADLLQADLVIEGARLYFEERKFDRAMELLDLAVAQNPADESMPLARLEITFLMRDRGLYTSLAGAFRAAHPASAQWNEVCRLGRAIAPDEAVFGSRQAARDSDHYGPWPDMPNWMRASWDLTPEVRAAEFHQAMARAT